MFDSPPALSEKKATLLILGTFILGKIGSSFFLFFSDLLSFYSKKSFKEIQTKRVMTKRKSNTQKKTQVNQKLINSFVLITLLNFIL